MPSKSGEMIVAAFVYGTTYSRNSRLFASTWLISPASSTMSVPARSGSHRSAIAEVRVKRGSTWTIVAPRSRAFITHRNPTGWFSAIDDPMIRIASAF